MLDEFGKQLYRVVRAAASEDAGIRSKLLFGLVSIFCGSALMREHREGYDVDGGEPLYIILTVNIF